MFRVIWFVGCLLVAALLAVIGKSIVPVLVGQIWPDGISHGIYDLLSRSTMVRGAVVLGLFVFFFTLLELGGQVLVDAITMRRLHQQIASRGLDGKNDTVITHRDFMKLASDAGDFAEPANLYAFHRVSSGKEPLQTKLPAAQVFDEQSQIRSRLNLWLFDNVLTLSMGAGVILFLFALVLGVDDVVFQSQLSLRTPVNGLLPALQAGLFALAILAICGLLSRAMTSYLVDLRRNQLASFTGLLDGLFYVGQSAVESLQKPLKSLSEAQALIAEDRSTQLASTLGEALEEFRNGLSGDFTKQVRSTRKLLEDTEKQVTKSTVAVEAAHDALAKYARGQSAAIDKAIAAALNNYFKDEGKSRAGLHKAIAGNLEAASSALMGASQESAVTLRKALEDLNHNYGGGLTDTAKALKDTQGEIAMLVTAVQHLAARSIQPPPAGQREDYLRLVGDDEFANDPPPLSALDPEAGEAEEGQKQIAQLAETLRGTGARGSKKSGKSSSELASKLESLKKDMGPSDLPEL